jgi:hypothetical protein
VPRKHLPTTIQAEDQMLFETGSAQGYTLPTSEGIGGREEKEMSKAKTIVWD